MMQSSINLSYVIYEQCDVIIYIPYARVDRLCVVGFVIIFSSMQLLATLPDQIQIKIKLFKYLIHVVFRL